MCPLERFRPCPLHDPGAPSPHSPQTRGASWRLLLRAASAGFVLAHFCLPAARPQQPALSEAHVKAAFVYNFAKFVEWPAQALPADAPVVVGVAGDLDLAAVVRETLRNKSVQGHGFEVRYFPPNENLSLCHILFVASHEKLHVQRILHVAQDAPTLTIGEIRGFSDWGGIIELVLEDNKFRFEINAGAARRGGLRVSSRLLRLARTVKGN